MQHLQHSNSDSGTAAQQFSDLHDLFDSLESANSVGTQEFKHFLDHIPIPLVVSRFVGSQWRIVYANHAFESKTGRVLAEIRGREWSILDAFRKEDEPEITIGAAVLSGDDYLGTFRVDGPPPILVQAYAGVITDESGAEIYRVAVLIDVTSRELAQREELMRQIRDKDLLLTEIQHRVKNNLQLITLLIRLEAKSE